MWNLRQAISQQVPSLLVHSVATDPCGAFSEHGYAGIETEVVKGIAHFIK